MFASISPTDHEREVARPGDELVAPADVVMDRAFTLDAQPDEVWPWLVQLGKSRAGWYLPRAVEALLPASRRATRAIDPRWQQLQVGDVVPDYGGKNATFEVARLTRPESIVYTSTRGRVSMSWAITLEPRAPSRTRVALRLRLAPVRHQRVADVAGGFFDAATIAGMAAGLRERVAAADAR
ncbi:hypothetical protein [uncultured Jatrophihabitans sp.]|uniref:hypothetical protein n=1 Tax=uncultured Jatrophihabitans sp. TaxID=1610747 RepID=UPI0035CB3A00